MSTQIKLSEVISALSYALDITEGQPEGHSARSCMLGMRIAKEIGLGPDESSALFYALLLKDLGCSSNARKVCYLFGADDRATKRYLKTADWTRAIAGGDEQSPSGVPNLRKEAKELFELRCDRGATIARELEFPELTADAIHSLDEHWDGQGYPDSLVGEEIPLLARILGVSQTVEVFINECGVDAAYAIARDRSGTWFDPDLVKALDAFRNDAEFWKCYFSERAAAGTAIFEPKDRLLVADEDRLDRIAAGFSKVIDAKSPWTYRHSEGVAKISVGIAQLMCFNAQDTRYLHRAALVHDVGKLGISNLILDKPGKLTPEETTEMRRHALYTEQILSRVDGFKQLADLAASHHERLDGKGYHRGLVASQLSTSVRILAVADMYEALTAKRPYRHDLTNEEAMAILWRDVGAGICPAVFDALKVHIARGGYVPEPLAA